MSYEKEDEIIDDEEMGDTPTEYAPLDVLVQMEIENDLIGLHQENEKFPSLAGVALEDAIRRFLEINDTLTNTHFLTNGERAALNAEQNQLYEHISVLREEYERAVETLLVDGTLPAPRDGFTVPGNDTVQ